MRLAFLTLAAACATFTCGVATVPAEASPIEAAGPAVAAPPSGR